MFYSSCGLIEPKFQFASNAITFIVKKRYLYSSGYFCSVNETFLLFSLFYLVILIKPDILKLRFTYACIHAYFGEVRLRTK